MSTPAPPKSNPGPQQPDDPEIVPVPPDEEFWEKYNRRFEFPFSTVGAVLLHVAVACLLVVLWSKMKSSAPDKALPLTVSNVDGLGEGSPGADLGNDAVSREEEIKAPPITAEDLARLPEVMDTIKDVLPDPTGTAIPESKLADFKDVDRDLARKLMRGDGTKGTGPGGFGADSAPAQSLRWTLRFRTRSGRDYLYQLSALGAKLLVPLGGEGRRFMLYEDLGVEPPRGRLATDEDLDRLSKEVRFFDRSRDSIEQVARALGLNERPRQLIAFLPVSLRNDLAAKEKAFANATSQEIEETVMMVAVAGGKADVTVTDQKLRNGKWIRK
jgi:hypothetical protein